MRRWAALFALLLWSTPALAQERPALVVLISIDQLGGDYLTRWWPLLEGGLANMRRRGAYFPNVVHDQANTATGPGHATIITGTWPNVHGIVSNVWHDPKDGALVYCVQDPKFGMAPNLMRVPAIGDQLRWATNGRSKVVSVAVKDRVAVLMAGKKPTFASWYDDKTGLFTSGKWYGVEKTPEWLDELNTQRNAAKSFGGTWNRLLPNLDYAALASPDDVPWEGKIEGLGRTFPHVYGAGKEGPDEGWADVYPGTPAALETLFEVVERAFEVEQLGKRGTTDLLLIGISTLDYAGHFWGPNSQEALDMLLRIDRALSTFMKRVDTALGGGRAVWIVTADHGIAPAPELASTIGLTAERVPGREIEALINNALKALARKGQPPLKMTLLDPPLIYLSHDDPGADRLLNQRAAAEALRKHPSMAEAWATADVDRFMDPFKDMYKRLVFPGREADLMYRGRPGDLISSKYGTGANHGSPYTYDTHVPVLIAGPRIRRSEDARPYPITTLVPTIAAILGITPPAAATERPLPISN